MPSREANGKETTIAFLLAVIFGLGSLFYSFAAAGDLFSVPAIALCVGRRALHSGSICFYPYRQARSMASAISQRAVGIRILGQPRVVTWRTRWSVASPFWLSINNARPGN